MQPYVQDMYGYTYRTSLNEQTLERYSPQGQIDNSFSYASDSGWDRFTAGSRKWFVSWSGDVYILHATDDGAVLTKYTLFVNHPPICLLSIVTPMPYTGPAPAPITFDATQSYDPDPGDTITYHWDFDGDGIFDEPGDSYTGNPNNPTHAYTQSYTGPVMLKVIDNHGAESVCTVTVVVIII